MRYGSQEWREREAREALARAQGAEAYRLDLIRRNLAADRAAQRRATVSARRANLTESQLVLVAASPVPDVTAAYLAARNQLRLESS